MGFFLTSDILLISGRAHEWRVRCRVDRPMTTPIAPRPPQHNPRPAADAPPMDTRFIGIYAAVLLTPDAFRMLKSSFSFSLFLSLSQDIK